MRERIQMKDPSEDYVEREPAEAGAATDPAARACVKCEHHRYSEDEGHWCQRPQLGVTYDPVKGQDVPNTRDCYDQRSQSDDERCGPEGRFFEPSGF
jgi:hypothetical protein